MCCSPIHQNTIPTTLSAHKPSICTAPVVRLSIHRTNWHSLFAIVGLSQQQHPTECVTRRRRRCKWMAWPIWSALASESSAPPSPPPPIPNFCSMLVCMRWLKCFPTRLLWVSVLQPVLYIAWLLKYVLTHSLTHWPLPIDHDDGQRREVTVHKKNHITKHALLTPTLSGNIISHSSHWDKAPKGQSGGGRECCTERTDLTTWYRQWIWDCITPIRLPLDPHPLAVLGCHSRSSSVANTPLNLLKEWQGWPHLPLPVWHNNTYGRDRGTADTEDGIASTDMKVG